MAENEGGVALLTVVIAAVGIIGDFSEALPLLALPLGLILLLNLAATWRLMRRR